MLGIVLDSTTRIWIIWMHDEFKVEVLYYIVFSLKKFFMHGRLL